MNISDHSISRASQTFRDALGDEELDTNWATVPIQKLLPYLCKESDEFRNALSDLVVSNGVRHVITHAPCSIHACKRIPDTSRKQLMR